MTKTKKQLQDEIEDLTEALRIANEGFERVCVDRDEKSTHVKALVHKNLEKDEHLKESVRTIKNLENSVGSWETSFNDMKKMYNNLLDEKAEKGRENTQLKLLCENLIHGEFDKQKLIEKLFETSPESLIHCIKGKESMPWESYVKSMPEWGDRKIPCIKYVKTATGWGLRASKIWVDERWVNKV